MSKINEYTLYQLLQALTDESRDPVKADRIFSMLFQYMDDGQITGAIHELAALEEMPYLVEIIDGKDRDSNPGKSGLPLGSVALGAALGAAAMHFGMKPKQ